MAVTGSAVAAPEDEAAPGALSTAERPSDASSGSPWRSYERFNPYTGELALTFRDIQLPGNGGLPIELYRSYRWTDGQRRDPGFQFKHTGLARGDYQANEIRCLVGACVCSSGGCPTSPRAAGDAYNMEYTELNPSSGLLKPGGAWRFAVAPEVEVQAFGAYFQPVRKWAPSTRLPVTQGVDLTYLHTALCASSTASYGGRAVEVQVVVREASGSAMMMTKTATGVLRSAGNWELRCGATTASPRLQLFAPDGIRYDLGQEVAASATAASARWLTTLATNLRTGASFAIAYDTSDARFIRPVTVTGSDGRVLTLVYDATTYPSVTLPYRSALRPSWISGFNVTLPVEPALIQARVGASTWTYEYNAPSQDAPLLAPTGSLAFTPPVRRALARFVPPAGRRGNSTNAWKFQYRASWNPDLVEHRSPATSPVAGDQNLASLDEPTGGHVSYELALDAGDGRWLPAALATEVSWETPVSRFCLAFQTIYGGIDGACPTLWGNLNNSFLASDRAARQQYRGSLVRRVATDVAAEAAGNTSGRLETTISYTRATQAGVPDRTTVRSSSPTRQLLDESYDHIGERYFAAVAQGGVTAPAITDDGWLIGQLLQYIAKPSATSAGPQLTTTYEWDRRTFASGPSYLRGINWHADAASYAGVLVKRTTTRQEVTGPPVVTTVTYGDFTSYGNPQRIVSEGPDPSSPAKRRQRTTTLTYYTNTARSLIDLPKNQVTQ